jgi:hypothetical protein
MGQSVAGAFMGYLLRLRGDYAAAGEQLATAAAAFEKIGEKYGLVRARLAYGYVRLLAQDVPGAAAQFAESLRVARQLGHTPYVLLSLAGCAAVVLLAGRVKEATRLFGRVAPLLESDKPYFDAAAATAREAYARYLPVARAQLSSEAFAAAWREGQLMTLEQATALGLAVACAAGNATASATLPPDVCDDESEGIRRAGNGDGAASQWGDAVEIGSHP